MTDTSVAPTATVRKAASAGSTPSTRRSIFMMASSKNVSDRRPSTSSMLPERAPMVSMRA